MASPCQSLLYRMYDQLTRNDPPRQADLIFVLAGRIERKRYGLELYRRGLTPRLLLSIGRFEVSKMAAFDVELARKLIALRDRTPPEQRHFFCEIDASGFHIEKPPLRRWNTYGEILALRTFRGIGAIRSMMVISTDVHLGRAAMVFDRVFRDAPLEVCYCPVPADHSSLDRKEWWRHAKHRGYVLKEVAKLLAYRTILSMPDALVARAMRLRRQVP